MVTIFPSRTGWARALTALPLLTVAFLSCNYTSPSRPVFGYENNDQACSDGIDNDNDGLIDCEDPDCIWHSSQCGEIVPPYPPNPVKENTVELCHDGIDNDGNGQFDCGDANCKAILENCCSNEFTNALCSDGIDNDQNGFTDCQDFSCSHGMYVTVCKGSQQVTPENTPALCRDGIDNDGNGKTDCRDPSCASLDVCKGDGSPEDTLAKCSDGIDNDGNGYIDCADYSCSKSTDPAIAAYCANLGENTLAKCSDGVDNDGNGFTDCGDYSCSKSTDPAIVAYCAQKLENTWAKCHDGIDNDGNGYTDCADYGCRNLPNPDTAVGGYACQESGAPAGTMCTDAAGNSLPCPDKLCSDGLDNDQDGFVDCADWDCYYNPQVTVCKNAPPVCPQ